MNQLQLEKMRYAFQTHISAELAEEMAEPPTVDVGLVKWATGTILLELRGFIWGRPVKDITWEYPADWWQAFKDRWFPAWAKERWPVVMRTRRITARELFPTVKAPPDLGPVMQVEDNTFTIG